jgi:hypothetical protein
MKRSAFLLSLLAGSVWAQTLTQGERDYAMSQLHATRKMLLDAINGLGPAQWNFKPVTEAWSIGQYVEHVILAEDYVRRHAATLLEKPTTGDRQPAFDNDTLYSRAADPDQSPIPRWSQKGSTPQQNKRHKPSASVAIAPSPTLLPRAIPCALTPTGWGLRPWMPTSGSFALPATPNAA